MIKVKDIEELKHVASYDNCQNDIFEGYISLAGGLVRSSKRILYFDDTDCWEVHHEIDETEELFNSTKEMLEMTNIGVALERGALYQYSLISKVS